MSPRYMSSADIDAMVARTAPAILDLLGGGMPRGKRAIVAALAERHPKDEVVRTLMRLAVTGRLVEIDRKYGLPLPPGPDQAGGLGRSRERATTYVDFGGSARVIGPSHPAVGEKTKQTA